MKRWWLAALCLLSLPAAWPLAQIPFFASDDGLFHLYRLAALDDALRHGVFYPRLFPSFGYGYGQAVLAYYGPLAYYAAEVPHLLGASFPDALKWAFALGYLLSGLALFMLARQYVAPLPALLGAAIYMYFPYHIAETYQRGALAEHLAFIVLPLILWGIMPPDRRVNPVRIGTFRLLVFALSVAALLLLHSLTALIFLPFAVVYFAVTSGFFSAARPPAKRDVAAHGMLRLAWLMLTALAIGLGLSAFYWLPILTESRWVGLSAGLDNNGYLEHLAPILSFVQPALVFQYAPHQIVTADHPLGLLSFILLLIALAAAVRAGRRGEVLRWQLAFFAGLSLVALFMTTDLSSAVWQTLHTPLSFLQYPWRFMTLAALGLSMCTAMIFQHWPRFALGVVPLVLLHALLGLQPVATRSGELAGVAAPSVDPQVMWENDFKARQIGATWTAEYVPWWVRADRTAIPAALRVPLSENSTPLIPSLSLLGASYTQRSYGVVPSAQLRDGTGSSLLRFHQFYLPQWHATLGGRALVTYPSTDLGLLSVELPANLSATGDVLELDFGLTDVERFAAFMSLAVLAAGAWLWRGWWLAPVALLAAMVFVFSLVSSASHPQAEAIQQSGATVSDFAELIAVRFEGRSYHAGDALRVTLTWIARRETREDFKSFVQLLDAGGAGAIAQSDGDPVGGFTPTSQWRSGEVIEETRELRIPEDVPPGSLPLIAGLYRLQPLQNLPAAQGSVTLPDGRIPLGEIQVVAQ
jgi:hypothetical protein